MTRASFDEMRADFERTGELAPMYARELFAELTRLREENERLTKLTDYFRNGEVNIDEQEAEYARLRRIEEAARQHLSYTGDYCANGKRLRQALEENP